MKPTVIHAHVLAAVPVGEPAAVGATEIWRRVDCWTRQSVASALRDFVAAALSTKDVIHFRVETRKAFIGARPHDQQHPRQRMD